MQPLSRRARLTYLLLFVAVFFITLPVVIFYADGWRFTPDIGFYKTGGIYVSVPYSGVTLSLRGEPVGTTGLLQKSFYIGDLPPSMYVLSAERPGYYPWERTLIVEPQLVTDTQVLLIPTTTTVTELVAATSTKATSTRAISRQTFDEYVSMFATSTISSTSTEPIAERDGIGLYVEGGDVVARWLKVGDPFPSVFCIRPSQCSSEIVVERGGAMVIAAGFFQDGVIFLTREGFLFFAELDARPIALVSKLFERPSSDFRIIDDRLIVKSGKELFEIEL